MPRNHPPEPDYRESGFGAEKRVWDALQALPAEAVVISQYRVLDDHRVTREADFLVLIPGVGIGVVEVKGGRVWTQDRDWYSRDQRGYDHWIHNPIEQAQRAGYAIAEFLQQQGVRMSGWVPVAVVPDTALPNGFQPADSTRGQWVDRGGLKDLAARLSAAIYTDLAPSADEVEGLVEALEQRLPKPVGRERAEDGLARADMVTRHQYAILRAVRTNNRILVTGGPGTGKTWLALEHARQETALGARVAVLCYNRGLALHMQRLAGLWPLDQQPACIATLHELALNWTGKAVPPDADSSFWDGLPAALEIEAVARSEEDRFDLVVVDEAQDFRPGWWLAVRALLRDPEEGPIVVFGDDDQELYGRGALGVPALEVSLSENVRNTIQIASVLETLTGEQQHCRGASGPAAEFLACAAEDVLHVADQAVTALQERGQFRPGDIALLTTHRRHPEHTRRLDESGPVAFAESLLSRDQIAVCTVKGFKGLERPVVVLAVNGFHAGDDANSLLRVGVSRATHQLVVVGEPEVLERMRTG